MRWDDYSDNFHDLDGDGRVSFEEEIIGDCLLADYLRQQENSYDDFDDDADDPYGYGEDEEDDLFNRDEEYENDEDSDFFGYDEDDEDKDEDDPYGYDEEDDEDEDEDDPYGYEEEDDEDEEAYDLVYNSNQRAERDLSPIVFGSEQQKNLSIEDFVCRAMIACIGRPEEDKNAPGGSVDKPDPLIMLGLAYYEFIELCPEERCRRLRECGFDPTDYPNYCV